MKARLNNLSRWLARLGANLRRVIGRPAKHKCAPQSWQGGQVI